MSPSQGVLYGTFLTQDISNMQMMGGVSERRVAVGAFFIERRQTKHYSYLISSHFV